MSEIQVIDNLNAVEVYDGKSLKPLLDKLDKDVSTLVVDISTAKGRKEVASIAARISKSKVYIDSIGKDLTDDWKKKSKVIDQQRKFARDFLDDLKMRFRAPLTEWEKADEARIAKHNQGMFELRERATHVTNNWHELTLERLERELATTEAVPQEGWEEFEHEATVLKFETLGAIKEAIKKREKFDAEQAELNELRELKAQKEREEIEANAAAVARQEADKKAELELVRANEEKENLEKAKLEAEQRALEAEATAKKNLEAEQAAINEEAKKREADVSHKRKINREALDAFKALGFSPEDSKKIVASIASRMIPNIEIKY